MRAKTLAITAVGAVAVATTALAVAPAGAAVTYYYYGYASGSVIRAVNSAITSQLSAESVVLTPKAGVSDTNTLASVHAQGVLTLGTVKTYAKTTAITGGQQVSVQARTANVNALNGLITATALTTTTTTKLIHGVYTTTTHSDLVGLKIGGLPVSANVAQNTTIKVGDVATVVVNAGFTGVANGMGFGIGAGLHITLLQKEGTANTGAEIDVNPTFTAVAPDSSPATGHGTVGNAYATRITAAAGKVLNVRSDPTAQTTVFAQGTGGKTETNSIAAVDLSPVGVIGAVQTTGVGTNTKTVASVTTTASVANVNLLNGLITAKAVKVTAHADLSKTSAAMTLVTLKIGTTVIPLNVKPNTVINLGIGKVIINQQIRSGRSITIRAVDIVLGKATGGLPVGAEIQLASASAGVN